MSDGLELTALRTPLQRVLPEWIDTNGHMNMAYYNLAFDRALDSALEEIGLGPTYVSAGRGTIFVAEAHVAYLSELREGDPLFVDFQLLDWDTKRLHLVESMIHADSGTLAATSEQLCLHVGMPSRRVERFSSEQLRVIEQMAVRHAGLVRPAQVGHRIAIPR